MTEISLTCQHIKERPATLPEIDIDIDDGRAIFKIPDDEHAELFRITYDVDEDKTLGEHDFVDSLRRVQLVEKAGDGLYGLGKKYSNSIEIDTQTYKNHDKGKLKFTWTIDYQTLNVDLER